MVDQVVYLLCTRVWCCPRWCVVAFKEQLSHLQLPSTSLPLRAEEIEERRLKDTVRYTVSSSFALPRARSSSWGWLHFYLRQKRNEWFTFATGHMRACRVGRLIHAPGLLSTSQLSNPSTQGGTACWDFLTAIWPCDRHRRGPAQFGALHMAPPPHAV